MLALLLLSAGFATAQESGAGVSKSTFAASRPKEGMQFLLDYLPVSVAQDECAKDRCNCSWLGDSFSVLQGRVSLHERGEGGFGLHLVATEHKLTTGGLTVEAVEASFSELGGMAAFDAFMDYNTHFFATHDYFDLLLNNFRAGGVPFLPFRFPGLGGASWYGAIAHVPNTQMVLEFSSNSSAVLAPLAATLLELEPRLPAAVLRRVAASAERQLQVAVVSRASSDVAAIEAFYVQGMNTTLSLFYESDDDTVKTRCVKWQDATDNHYAIDAPELNAEWILRYLDDHEDARYVCNGDSVHYLFDPTGFAVQLDMGINGSAVRCDARDWDSGLEPDYSCWNGVCADAFALAFGGRNASLPFAARPRRNGTAASEELALAAAVGAPPTFVLAAGLVATLALVAFRRAPKPTGTRR
ncbi:hypothetical protein JL722_8524 [Aureococcus anophagefferens]|nr:hypothetical protein JL722_8524 [Aureococcus anophagefferens]